MLSVNDRFELNAAIERLVADGTTFESDDAVLLIEKLPLSVKSVAFSVRYEDRTPDKGVEGFAAGLGNVRIGSDKPRVKEVGLLPDVIRIGGYKIRHWPGQIHIELMWADSNINPVNGIKEDRSAILHYNVRSKSPHVLMRPISRPLQFVLWPKPRVSFVINLVSHVAWKKPAPADSPEKTRGKTST